VDSFLARNGVAVDVTMEFDNIDSMIRAVEANNAVSILPEATVRKETADGSLRVVACKQMKLTRPLGIIVKRSGKLTRAADEFASMLLGRPLTAAAKPAGPTASTSTGVSVVA
jgi:DNA-binding transcriptional LysR family regulator